MSQNEQPLKGKLVIELTQNLPGPYAGRLLCDLGARVVKVEPLPRGDTARMVPNMFKILNFGKESVALNLKDPEGIRILKKFIEKADIILEGFRPGVADKLGIGFNDCKVVNPSIKYCSISGYGYNNHLTDLPAHDLNLQAISGLASLPGSKNVGLGSTSLPVADFTAALFAVNKILGALLANQSGGSAQFIDMSMADGISHIVATWSQSLKVDVNQVKLPPNPILRNLARSKFIENWFAKGILNLLPHYGIYKCKNKSRICLGIVNEDHFWQILCEAFGGNFLKVKHLKLIQRVLLAPLLSPLVKLKLRSRSAQDWLDQLIPLKIPVSPVHTHLDTAEITYFKERKRSFMLDGRSTFASPLQEDLSSEYKVPKVGEDTYRILKELGLDQDLNSLADKKVIAGINNAANHLGSSQSASQ